MQHQHYHRKGRAVLGVVVLSVSCWAHAQVPVQTSVPFATAGAPASDAVEASWTTDAQAPAWGDTPASVRTLLIKLQAMRANGPDAFDVVWLREFLRRPALYHLDDSDQAWMHRTILAADQAHMTHWRPAALVTPPTAPSVVVQPITPPAVAQVSPIATNVPSPVVVASSTIPAPAVVRSPSSVLLPPATKTISPRRPSSVVGPSLSTSPAAQTTTAWAPGGDTLSTGWAMVLAALFISAGVGFWVRRAQPHPANPAADVKGPLVSPKA